MAVVEALQLPDILTRVLQLVDTHQRITCCSLVSHTWNAAASAATTSICVRHLPDGKVTLLQGWVARHGSHLTSITTISSDGFGLVSRLSPWLTQLRELQLQGVSITASLDPEVVNVLSRTLTALTGLYVDTCNVDGQATAVGSLRFLSSLKHLQDLQFGPLFPIASVIAADAQRILPLSLTKLRFMSCKGSRNVRVPAGPASVLPQLTNLRHLDVFELAQIPSIQLNPGVLSCLVQLTTLVYRQLPYGAHAREWNETDTTSLLSGFRYLTQLQHLNLGCTLKAALLAMEQYSTLTSSSSLTHLSLHHSRVPGGYLHHMLPMGRQLTALKALDVSHQYVVGRHAMGTLTHIISTCPSLQELAVSCSARDASELAQLTQLSKLTSLRVGGPNFNQGFVPALIGLARLRVLMLHPYQEDGESNNELNATSGASVGAIGSLSTSSLLELRCLTQLTKLFVGGSMCREASVPEISLEKKPMGLEVWEQLNDKFLNLPQLACFIDADANLPLGGSCRCVASAINKLCRIA